MFKFTCWLGLTTLYSLYYRVSPKKCALFKMFIIWDRKLSSVLGCQFSAYFRLNNVFCWKIENRRSFKFWNKKHFQHYFAMSPRFLPVSIDEYLVSLDLHFKFSHIVTVWYRDIRELKHKLASNLRILLTFEKPHLKTLESRNIYLTPWAVLNLSLSKT